MAGNLFYTHSIMNVNKQGKRGQLESDISTFILILGGLISKYFMYRKLVRCRIKRYHMSRAHYKVTAGRRDSIMEWGVGTGGWVAGEGVGDWGGKIIVVRSKRGLTE